VLLKANEEDQMQRGLLKGLCLLGVGSLLVLGCGSEPENPSGFKVVEETPEVVKGIKVETSPEASIVKPAQKPKFKPFKVYTDANSPDNHYAPSGWMGDYGDIQLSQDHFDNPRSGTTSMKISYSAARTQGANWAGMYWQNPPNNWGSRRGGYDLTGASKCVFWARGEKGGEKVDEFRVGGIPGEYADSDVAGIGPVILTQEWKRYEIDLTDMDLVSISGGFMWSANVDGNPQGFVIYLDDIRYE